MTDGFQSLERDDLSSLRASPTDLVTDLEEGRASPDGRLELPQSPKWDFFEKVTLVALCAISLRVVVSVASSVIEVSSNSAANESGSGQVTLAYFLTWAASFGDITGIIILLAVVALLWWLISHWSNASDASLSSSSSELELPENWEEEISEPIFRLERLRWLCGWTRILFLITVVGSLCLLIATFLGNSVNQPEYFVRQGGTQLTFIPIGICGLLACWRLYRGCNSVLQPDDSTAEDGDIVGERAIDETP